MGNGADARIAVLGLGRFGSSLAIELTRQGSDVIGADSNGRIVQNLADRLTHAAIADTTDLQTLQQLGVNLCEHSVVAIGTDLEASILTTSALVDMNIPNIWAKATSRDHGKILERVGAHHVVLPEHEMGERVAHLVTGRMLDYIKFEDDYAMVKTLAPREAEGRPLGETRIRSKYGVTIVSIKRPGEDFTYATPDTVVRRGDILIVAGRSRATEKFASLT